MIDEGPSRGRRARRCRAESFLSVIAIPPQQQEMVGQKWGKHQVVFSRSNLWYLYILGGVEEFAVEEFGVGVYTSMCKYVTLHVCIPSL